MKKAQSFEWTPTQIRLLEAQDFMPGDSYLDALAATVLDAFDFDSDHLYRFSYKDRFGRTVEIDHPYLVGDFDHALADEVKVGDLPLIKGMHIGFLFDFGDQ